MFPKEHGAWNALAVCLAAGWLALGEWNPAALAASLFWISGFLLRAPFLTARQYRGVDSAKSRRALLFFAFLLAVLIVSGAAFWRTAPPASRGLAFSLGAPLGLLMFLLAALRRTLRNPAIEALGFAGVALLVPVLYLTGSPALPSRALLLYALFGGYFLLALIYVKVRQAWVARSRAGDHFSGEQRFWDGRWVILTHAVFLVAILVASRPGTAMTGAALYALFRAWAGLKWGKPDLPLMKLGVREMIHSIVFTLVALSGG